MTLLTTATRQWLIDRARQIKKATNGNTDDFRAVRRAFAMKGLRYPDTIMDSLVRKIVVEMRESQGAA